MGRPVGLYVFEYFNEVLAILAQKGVPEAVLETDGQGKGVLVEVVDAVLVREVLEADHEFEAVLSWWPFLREGQ